MTAEPSPDQTVDRCDGAETAQRSETALPQRDRSMTPRAFVLDDLALSPFDAVQFIIDGVPDFAALHTAVELDIFEHLADKELTSDELATVCAADPGAMRRLMRWLHSRDFVATYGQRYQLTALGQALTAAAERSQRHAVLVTGSSYWWEMIRRLSQTVRRGRPDWPNGLTPYDYLAQHPEAGQEFDRFMNARSADLGHNLATFSDFADVRVIADLGGGLGGVLATILTRHQRLRGILADREDVLTRARQHLVELGLADRIRLAPVDFFNEVPTGAQIYLLSSILHNHSDEQCVRLLSTVRKAILSAGEDAEVWIAEGMLPRLPGARSPWNSTDIRMLSLFDGDGVRTSDDIFDLVRGAGLRVTRTSRLSCGQSLVIARADGG